MINNVVLHPPKWQFWRKPRQVLDEVIVENANVHIENMGDHWSVILDLPDEQTLILSLGSGWGICDRD